MLKRLVIAAALLAAAPAVRAGDAAQRDIIGFSSDGRWFAFEEHGIQDGSGFPYSNIYVVDLYTDRWAHGTPVRVLLQDGPSGPPPLEEARTVARRQASDILHSLDVSHPGRLLASSPITEDTLNAGLMRFRPHYNLDDTITLRLETFPLEPAEPCPDPQLEAAGFALSVALNDQPRREIYRDGALPASRGCPLDYRLADVIAYDIPGAGARYVVLVHRLSFGFEGPDARFLAVPAVLP